MSNYSYTIYILILPLLGFLLLGLFGKKRLKNTAGLIGTVSIFAVSLLSWYAAAQYLFQDGKLENTYRKISAFHFNWLELTPQLSIDMGIIIDPISVMMLVVISTVSLMVHLFSLGYMKGEERFATYYAFLSLFTFSMLGLVLSVNIFQIYIFWELVGVSSFLLIGFYFNKPSAVAASKKAFIVTRFADLGFLIGILVLGYHAQTFEISTLIERLTNPQTVAYTSIATASFLGASALTWGLLLVFIGGAGKSAMFPLHIWLPDAMEGPTPVSALIHAATMVVAGVYLVGRLFPVFSMSTDVMTIISYTGVFSALLAAVIACTQTDIKRVLAYSTMSQIGYMMFALGVSGMGGENGLGYMASMFHLFTHAFFKSLLFLGAGAVIHLVHSNEIKDMGGLRKIMPVTHLSFLIACLAIAGIPPFSGFFSKEEILTAAYHSNKLVYWIAIFTAGLTAFYMFRLYFSIFWSKDSHTNSEHGEGTLSMKIPLILLSFFTMGAGFVPFSQYVTSDGKSLEMHLDLSFSILPVSLAILSILLAAYFYKNKNDKSTYVAILFGRIYRGAYKKFYIDEVYFFITKRVIFPLVGAPIAWIDKYIVDGLYMYLAVITSDVSTSIKKLQSGKVQHYALYVFSGIIILSLFMIYILK